MKSKHKTTQTKCRECKGTGVWRNRNARGRSPEYICEECAGTGKAQHFEIFFWNYDLFPFVIAARGFMQDNGTCYCPSYNASFRPFMSLPLSEGLKLKAWLNAIEDEHRIAQKSFDAGFLNRVLCKFPQMKKHIKTL